MPVGRVLVLVFVVFLAASPSWADVAHLRDGRSIEGKCSIIADKVRIERSDGVTVLESTEVEHIESGATLDGVFAGRLKAAKNAAGCLELANWAQQNDMARQYVFALRAALLMDRSNTTARAQLTDYRRRMADLPYDNLLVNKMLRDLDGNFRYMRTRHYRICYNSNAMFADMAADLLEEVYFQFLQYFTVRNFEPAPITDRLELALFANNSQFSRHASQIEPSLSGSAGFYSRKTARCYFYDSAGTEEYSDYTEKLDEEQQKLDEFRRQVQSENRGSRRYIVTDDDGTERHFKRAEMLRELENRQQYLDDMSEKLGRQYTEMNISVTVHEATHQLAYACGMHSRYYDTPKWLIEGLALYFEAPQEGGWSGPGKIHPDRLRTFVEDTIGGRLNIKKLICDDDLFGPEHRQVKSAYAATWSLFYYLSNQQHDELFEYIYELSLRISDEPYSQKSRLADFEKYFGDIDRLEHNLRFTMAKLARMVLQ